MLIIISSKSALKTTQKALSLLLGGKTASQRGKIDLPEVTLIYEGQS